MADDVLRRHTICALVDNEPGVLARVIGLFSGRGYNIDSLTVAQVDADRGLSRINLVATGTELVIEQIKSLLSKLVPVHRVQDLTALEIRPRKARRRKRSAIPTDPREDSVPEGPA